MVAQEIDPDESERGTFVTFRGGGINEEERVVPWEYPDIPHKDLPDRR